MSRRNSHPQRLRNEDVSDRELLSIVGDLADNDGWVSTEDLADRVFGTGGSADRRLHSMRCVGIRFAWLARYGVVEKSGPPNQAWRLTDTGEALMSGSARKVEQQVDRTPYGDLLHLAMAVGERYQEEDHVARTMMRRALTHHTARRT